MLLRADQLWLLNVIYPPRKKTQFHVLEKIKGQRTKPSRREDENEIESAVGTPSCFTVFTRSAPRTFGLVPYVCTGMAVKWDVYTKENIYLNLQLWRVD